MQNTKITEGARSASVAAVRIMRDREHAIAEILEKEKAARLARVWVQNCTRSYREACHVRA